MTKNSPGPLDAAVGSALPTQEVRPFHRPTGHVLVIDDDACVLEVACALLLGRGWSTSSAASLSVALDAARLRRPAVVLLDLTMPNMSAAHALRLLHSELGAVPIVLMSGHTSEQAAADAPVAAGFLSKPFTGDELVQALADALQHVRPPCAANPATTPGQEIDHALPPLLG